MTLLDAVEHRYKEEKNKLKEKCKRGIESIRESNKKTQYWPGDKFHELFSKQFEYNINRIELTSVAKNSNGKYYQQFLIQFEDNTIEYIYVLIGDSDGKKA